MYDYELLSKLGSSKNALRPRKEKEYGSLKKVPSYKRLMDALNRNNINVNKIYRFLF